MVGDGVDWCALGTEPDASLSTSGRGSSIDVAAPAASHTAIGLARHRDTHVATPSHLATRRSAARNVATRRVGAGSPVNGVA